MEYFGEKKIGQRDLKNINRSGTYTGVGPVNEFNNRARILSCHRATNL